MAHKEGNLPAVQTGITLPKSLAFGELDHSVVPPYWQQAFAEVRRLAESAKVAEALPPAQRKLVNNFLKKGHSVGLTADWCRRAPGGLETESLGDVFAAGYESAMAEVSKGHLGKAAYLLSDMVKPMYFRPGEVPAALDSKARELTLKLARAAVACDTMTFIHQDPHQPEIYSLFGGSEHIEVLGELGDIGDLPVLHAIGRYSHECNCEGASRTAIRDIIKRTVLTANVWALKGVEGFEGVEADPRAAVWGFGEVFDRLGLTSALVASPEFQRVAGHSFSPLSSIGESQDLRSLSAQGLSKPFIADRAPAEYLTSKGIIEESEKKAPPGSMLGGEHMLPSYRLTEKGTQAVMSLGRAIAQMKVTVEGYEERMRAIFGPDWVPKEP